MLLENDKMEKIVSLAKRRGFIFPGSELYGGLANSWDYGPLGHLLKQNIKSLWWKFFVQERDDMVPLDSAIIMNPRVWEASGHLQNFTDELVECKKCHHRFRLDQIPDFVEGQDISKLKCPDCGGIFTDPKSFNLMFKTFIGTNEDTSTTAYLRPETAGGMFINFKNVLNVTRRRLPFGIAQIGKCFRNEITPGNFIFRTREFEIGDLEYTDPETGEKYLPHVIEPTFGIERMLLVSLLEAYTEEEAPTTKEGETEARIVMKFPKHLAPIQVAVLPLSKKEELSSVSRDLANDLRKNFSVDYDETQSIGKRYRRQDEVGTPYCVTVDFDSLVDKKVTVRDRDTMVQERIDITDLKNYLIAKF